MTARASLPPRGASFFPSVRPSCVPTAAPSAAVLLALLALAGCGSAPTRHTPAATPPAAARPAPTRPDPTLPVLPAAGSGRGGYYMDDGPGDNPPPGLMDTPDAEVTLEPYRERNSRPYVVFGKTYTPLVAEEPFVQRGVASWYGKKFHSQRTSSGEPYDMYKMTGAHPTLPIPSYARVTSVVSGKSVVVRINDRGPFHSSRIIDVSYTAALKLGLLGKGSHEVVVERLLKAEVERMVAARQQSGAGQSIAAQPGEADPQHPATMTMTPTPAPRPSGAETAPAQRGYYLQLGAFARAEGAEQARSQLAQHASLGTLEVVQAGSVSRLYGGPFASRAEAAQVAAALPDALHLKPIVVQR